MNHVLDDNLYLPTRYQKHDFDSFLIFLRFNGRTHSQQRWGSSGISEGASQQIRPH